MNNLKRVLSLALSGIMLVGMMAVGAGAVNGKDFTDADKIQHTEAVNTLVTLNVINGKDDGSHYDPEGTLTRAEMAKLVVYVLNGGVEPVMSTKPTPTYSDIKGHWAEKYIEYCSNLGIIAGQGDGTFNPGGTLTGSQAAKMMLVAMNYDSNVFGFTGADWELSVNSEANKAKLYEDLNGLNPSAEISRDDAAQLVYNGMLANTMELSYSQSLADGKVTQNYEAKGNPLFQDKFNGQSFEGIMVASGKYAIAGVQDGQNALTASKDYFKVQLKKVGNLELTANTQNYQLDDIQSFKYAEDLTPLMGERVRVLWNTSKRTVYGVYSMANENVVVRATSDKVPTADQKADSIKIDGTTYDTSAALTANATYADDLKFVDNDNDGKLDIVVENQVGLYKVTYVGGTTFTLSHVSGRTTATALNQKLADVTVYDGMKKDDYVLVSNDMYNAKDRIVKAEVTEGTIGGKRTNSNNNSDASDYDYRLDGTWGSLIAGYQNVPTSFDNGKSVEYIKVGGKIAYMKVTEAAQGVSDIVMLITTNSVGQGGNNGIDNQQAKLLFSDGSKKTVTLSSDGVLPQAGDCGKLYTYEMDGSNYELTALTSGTGNDVGDYKGINDTNIVASGNQITKVGSTDIADDAVVFLFKGTTASVIASAYNDGKVITGKDLKGLDVGTTALATNGKKSEGVLASTVALTKKTNGIVKVGVMSASCNIVTDNSPTVIEAEWPVGASSANYGYITDKPYTTKIDGKSYAVYPTWNGTETVEYKVEASSVKAGIGKNGVIGYDLGSGEEIKNIQSISMQKDAITGLDGKEVQFDANPGTYKITGDTKILYVNGSKGAEGGELQLATEVATGKYAQNVKFLANNNKELELIVVDTENKLADADKMGSNLSLTISNATASFSKDKPAVGDIVTVTLTAGSGKTFTSIASNWGVTGDCVLSGTYELTQNDTVCTFDVLFTDISNNVITVTGITCA